MGSDSKPLAGIAYLASLSLLFFTPPKDRVMHYFLFLLLTIAKGDGRVYSGQYIQACLTHPGARNEKDHCTLRLTTTHLGYLLTTTAAALVPRSPSLPPASLSPLCLFNSMSISA